MKKIIALFTFAALAASSFATESKEAADVYELEEIAPAEISPSKRQQREEERKRKSAPVELKSSSVFRYNAFETDVSQDDTAIFYYPTMKEIGFTATSTKALVLSFDKKSQDDIKAAFETYKTQFENKELVNKKSKTSKIYGKTKCHYLYDTFFKDQDAEPEVRLGYVFVKKSPYFLLTVEESKTKIRNPVDKDRDAKTKKMKILFNKNQMQTLIDQFDYTPGAENKTETEAEKTE